MSREISLPQTLEVIECARCCISFAMPSRFTQARRDDHANFFCPSGHPNVFQAKSEAETLRVQLREADRLRAIAETDRASAIAETKRIGERVTNGACPCCNRSFRDLRSHMKSKHSEVKRLTAGVPK